MAPTRPPGLPPIDKQQLVREVLTQLQAQLAQLTEAARHAHASATHDEARAEDQYDTRALELSYLAAGQSARAAELEQAIAAYKFITVPDRRKDAEIDVGTLLLLEDEDGKRTTAFLGPAGATLKLQLGGHPVQVISPVSPLGRAVVGKRAGDTVDVEVKGELRESEVLAVR